MTSAAAVDACRRRRRRPPGSPFSLLGVAAGLGFLLPAAASGQGLPFPPAPAPAAASPAAGPAAPPPPLTDAEFATLLASDDLVVLDDLCRRSVLEDSIDRVRVLQQRLLTLHPAPQPPSLLLANAEVLLTCQAPEAALRVLERHGPAPGPERVGWLRMQWRAASAALDHRRASLALERLVAIGQLPRLDGRTLPVQRREDGSVVSRSALDLLADHLVARGMERQAAELLLAAPRPGTAGAERLQQVVALLAEAPASEREGLLEIALEQAAAEGSWGLVAELLDQQLGLASSSRAIERRLRLSPQLDDAYGEWRLRRDDPAAAERARQLELQLRSPRSPGGHAASSPPQVPALPVLPDPPIPPADIDPLSQP